MKKPLVFALRGALGFGLTPVTGAVGMSILIVVIPFTGHQPPEWLSEAISMMVVLITFMIGATVFSYGVAHWKRAALGFGAVSIPAMAVVIGSTAAANNSPGGGMLKFCVCILGWGVGFALFGGIGGLCLHRKLGLSGAVFFGLPGACLAALGWEAPTTVLLLLLTVPTLVIGGAFLGRELGRLEQNSRATPPQPD